MRIAQPEAVAFNQLVAANNSARVLIHDDHAPVRLQCNGFGAEQESPRSRELYGAILLSRNQLFRASPASQMYAGDELLPAVIPEKSAQGHIWTLWGSGYRKSAVLKAQRRR